MANVNAIPALSRSSGGIPNPVRDSIPLPLSNSANEHRDAIINPGPEVGVSVPPETAANTEEFISSVAAMVAAQRVPSSDLNVWGVLTAITDKARKRKQGVNMLLTSDEHCIGRLVEDTNFRIMSPAVSARHCKITRKLVATKDTEHQSDCCFSVFLKDTSTNGTYLNWEKLSKSAPEVKLSHGDIVSVAFAPHNKLAFAFVFREVKASPTLSPCRSLKRKPDDFSAESKRHKGIGIGASDGPVSLDDFRSLQRSNTDLRKLLEDNVVTIESLRKDNHMINEKHESEMRELKESTSRLYADKLSELKLTLEAKNKELTELNKISADQRHEIDTLNQRLTAYAQSCVEANEIIDGQKMSISQLKAQLEEERDLRREEREKASVDMKMALQKVQAEAEEKIKLMSDCALKREKEQQVIIQELQESEKERSLLVETLRSKLEDTREKLVTSDNELRQLVAQISQEREATAVNKKKLEHLEHERTRLKKELENEKAAREEAWAKVSALELEISTAKRDLDYERRRLKAAKERIMLRETQLRAFYSTTEEIQLLFVKQQEQLETMQRTLEDQENYECTSIAAAADENENISTAPKKAEAKLQLRGASSRREMESSSDETIATDEHCHDDDAKAVDHEEDTQEVEFMTIGVNPKVASDDNTVGTEQMPETEGIGTARILETEHVLETESQGRNVSMDVENRPTTDACLVESRETNPEPYEMPKDAGTQDPMQCTYETEDIRTADLVASEVAGSWACNPAPSVPGENKSPRSKNDDQGDRVPTASHDSSESQEAPIVFRRAFSRMIGIVAPDLSEQFCQASSDRDESSSSISDTDTEEE